jgi:hypothetical protein
VRERKGDESDVKEGRRKSRNREGGPLLIDVVHTILELAKSNRANMFALCLTKSLRRILLARSPGRLFDVEPWEG